VRHATNRGVPSLKLRQVLLVSAVAAAVVASSSTAGAQQYEARTVAPPTTEHTGQGKLMLGVTGAILLGLPYGFSVQSAASSSREGDRWLYAPVLGPWGTIIDRNTCQTTGCRGNIASDTLPLVTNGIAQAAGLALIVVALSMPTNPVSAPPAAARPTLHIAPASYQAGAGIAAFGTF
jgi:hypothetical protein